jgi:hypothetical protein
VPAQRPAPRLPAASGSHEDAAAGHLAAPAPPFSPSGPGGWIGFEAAPAGSTSTFRFDLFAAILAALALAAPALSLLHRALERGSRPAALLLQLERPG